MTESINFLNKLNISNNVIVGCSGGADSMCLMHLLVMNGYNVICAHVHHGLRKESDKEVKFVEEYAKKLNIPFEVRYLNLDKKNEESFRIERYKFFKELAIKYNTQYIATAHHGDDLIETVLMRIVRGSNIKGYSGFLKVNKVDGYIFLKPLIFYSKNDLIQYCNKNNIDYVTDNSNFDLKYSRNRFRHNILPALKEENPDVNYKFYQFSNRINEIYKYINRDIEKFIKDNFKNNSLKLEYFYNKDNIFKEMVLEKIFSIIYENNINKITSRHVRNILEKIESNTNFLLCLPLNVKVYREYDKLTFSKEIVKKEEFDYIFNNIFETENYIIKISNETTLKSNNILRLNLSDIALPLHIRSKRDGDIICVKNLNGSKKIKSIFIESKIPKSIRNNYPIVVDNNNTVLWVPGLKKSKFDMDVSEKYDIILRYIEKGKN